MENLELQVKSSVKDEQVEKLVEEKGKVTNEEIEASLNYNNLTQEEKDAIEEFNKKINVEDATQVLQYGAKAQGKISAFSDSVLEDVKTKSVGEVGDLLSDLVGEIKSFSTEIDNSNATGLASTLEGYSGYIGTNLDLSYFNMTREVRNLLKDEAIDKAITLLTNEEERLDLANEAFNICKKYTWENAADEWIEMFNKK